MWLLGLPHRQVLLDRILILSAGAAPKPPRPLREFLIFFWFARPLASGGRQLAEVLTLPRMKHSRRFENVIFPPSPRPWNGMVVLGSDGDLTMAPRTVWRPTMYGGLASAILGSLAIVAGWTSPNPSVCFLQFIAILGCGMAGGLIVANGPVQSVAWVLGASHPNAAGEDVARRVGCLSLVAGLGTALVAAWEMPALRLLFLMFAWVIALLLLMAVEPRTETPRRPWEVAFSHAVMAVYGPFLVAA